MKTFFLTDSIRICLMGLILVSSNQSGAQVILGDPDKGGIDYDLTFQFPGTPGQWLNVETGDSLPVAGSDRTGQVGLLDSNGWGSQSADGVLWAKIDLGDVQARLQESPRAGQIKYLKITATLEGIGNGGLIPAMTAWLGRHDLESQSGGEGESFPNRFQEQVPFWFANGLTHGGELSWDADQDGDGIATIQGLIPAVSNGLYNYITLALGGNDPGGFQGLAIGSQIQGFKLSAVIEAVAVPVPLPGAILLFGTGLIGLMGLSNQKKAILTANV